MSPHEVVVTACGIVSPLGIGVPEFGRRMFAGESGTVDIRGSIVPKGFPVRVAAIVPRDRLGQPSLLADRAVETTPLTWRFAGLATEEALDGLPPGCDVDAIVYAAAE